MRLTVLKLSLLVAASLAAVVLFGQQAEAYSGQGYFSGRTGNWYSGYGGDVMTGRPGRNAIPGGLGKNGFISFIKNNLNGSNAKDRTGAAFIINTMVGAGRAGNPGKARRPGPAMINEWENRIRDGSISMHYGYGDPNGYGNGRISFYDPGINDDFYTNYNSGARPLLIFRHNGRVAYVLEVPCANPVGGLPGLPRSANAARFEPRTYANGNLGGPVTINNMTGTARFEHRVRVTGYDGKNHRVTYRIQRARSTNNNCPGTGSWNTIKNGSFRIDRNGWYNIWGPSDWTGWNKNTTKRLCQRTVIVNRDGATRVGGTPKATINVTKSANPGGRIDPEASVNPDFVEVGGSVTGQAAYTSTYNRPPDYQGNSYGYSTRQNRGPYIAYETRMWIDDGSETWMNGLDQNFLNYTNSRRAISDNPVSSPQYLWGATRGNVDLSPPDNPRFMVCISNRITKAWYETRTRSIDPPWNHTHANGTIHRHSASPNSWGGWQEVPVPYNGATEVSCAIIQKYPSLEVRGGDIEVGGVFREGLSACATDMSDTSEFSVVGHAHSVAASQRGSKGQYGVAAAGPITDFGSNNILYGQVGSQALDFANVGGLGYFYGSGGPMVSTACFDDAFEAYPNDMSPLSIGSGVTRNVGAGGNGASSFMFDGDGGTLRISGSPSAGQRRIIRVSGMGGSDNKVLIADPIDYGTTAVGSADQLPQFILLVDDPDIDIRIEDDVTRLDGLYVTRGSFHTCAEFDIEAASNPIYLDDAGSICREELIVNGAIIAGDQLVPYRTDGANASTGAQPPAEIFNLRGDLLIAEYARKKQTGNLETIGQMELPPRF